MIWSSERFAAVRAEVIGVENADSASEMIDSNSALLNFAR